MWRILIPVLLSSFIFCYTNFAEAKSNGLYGFEECNWLVTYRNRTYDLTPLTRVGLSRPIESDLRPVLERVTESADKLALVSQHARNAKAHSIIGSAAISAFVLNKIFLSGSRSSSDDAFNFTIQGTKINMDIISLVSSFVFIKASFESWKSTKESKTELVNAIEFFNEKSPYKIEATKGASNAQTP